MMTDHHQGSFPTFDNLTIDASTDEKMKDGASNLIRQIRPEWNPECHSFKIFTDGITNKLIGVYDVNEGTDDMILVRIYGDGSEQMIDREAEIRNMLLLQTSGFAKPLYARFDNGVAYGFAPGDVLNKNSLIKPEVWKAVARKMAGMHKMKIEEENGNERKSRLWEYFRKFLEVSPEGFPGNPEKQARYLKGCMKKEEILKEIIELEPIVSELGSPVVFCHNDLLPGNIIFKDSDVSFIDFEYGFLNYQAYDIANHFDEFVGIEDVLDYERWYPDEEFQKAWIKVYLKTFNENENNGEPSESEIHRMYVQVTKFALMPHLFWGIWGLVQAKVSKIDFDFLDYAIQRFNEYKKRKGPFLATE